MEATLELSAYEIERGKPIPSKNHAIVQGNLLFFLRSLMPQYQILPEITIDFPVRERVPDLAIYQNIVTFRPGNDEVRLSEIPLGLIEIWSTERNITELMIKRTEYFAAGVQSYWLVIPDLLTIYVFYNAEDYDIFTRKEQLHDKKLDISLNLGDIFK